MKTIRIDLVQGEKMLTFEESVESRKLDEISGTLAYNILTLRQDAKEFGVKLDFSFARKFDVKIIIDGIEKSTSELFKSKVKFPCTVQSTDKSYEKFHKFIHRLVMNLLAGADRVEGTFEELKSDLILN